MNWQDILKVGYIPSDEKKRKKVLSENLEKKILDEIEKEGGALGMKNLKQFGSESEIKETLSRLEKEGKLFMHKDGDIYTHNPIKKFFGRKPQEQTFEENGIKFSDQKALDEYKKLKSQYPQLTQRLQQLQSQYQTNIPIGTVQSEFERGLKEQRQQQAQQQTQPPVQPRGSKYGASGEGYSWRG